MIRRAGTFYRTLRKAGEDYDIKIVTNFNGITGLGVNAFQTASDVLLQKSQRRIRTNSDRGLETDCHRRQRGRYQTQIEDSENGYLVSTVEECGKVLHLLRNPLLAQEMSERAGKSKKGILVTKNVLQYLKLFKTRWKRITLRQTETTAGTPRLLFSRIRL